MFDDGHVPFISRVHWSWAYILSASTGGAFLLLLGLYLAWWSRKRRGRGVAVYLYALEVVTLCLVYVAAHTRVPANVLEGVITIVILAWIATSFVLRSELRLFYGKQFEINPLLTAMFSVLYLNYCLWAIGDAPLYE